MGLGRSAFFTLVSNRWPLRYRWKKGEQGQEPGTRLVPLLYDA